MSLKMISYRRPEFSYRYFQNNILKLKITIKIKSLLNRVLKTKNPQPQDLRASTLPLDQRCQRFSAILELVQFYFDNFQILKQFLRSWVLSFETDLSSKLAILITISRKTKILVYRFLPTVYVELFSDWFYQTNYDYKQELKRKNSLQLVEVKTHSQQLKIQVQVKVEWLKQVSK